jgi:hypothetical protein
MFIIKAQVEQLSMMGSHVATIISVSLNCTVLRPRPAKPPAHPPAVGLALGHRGPTGRHDRTTLGCVCHVGHRVPCRQLRGWAGHGQPRRESSRSRPGHCAEDRATLGSMLRTSRARWLPLCWQQAVSEGEGGVREGREERGELTAADGGNGDNARRSERAWPRTTRVGVQRAARVGADDGGREAHAWGRERGRAGLGHEYGRCGGG